MRTSRLISLTCFALAALAATLLCQSADGATSVKSSAHFRIIYQSDKASSAYAEFILKESERSWKAIFTTLGYKEPKWMSDRIAAGGKVMISLREMDFLGMASYRWNAAKVMTTGKIEFNYEAKFKRGGKTNWHILRGTCAHELFHLVQGAYDIIESKWLKETTAVWMEAHAFPKEAKAHPTRYGYRRFLGNWNNNHRRKSLMSVGDKQEYAASIFIHYLTEHESKGVGLVKDLWIKAGAVKGDTTAKAIGQILGDSDAWGENALKRLRGLSLTDLIRSSKRHKTLSLASLVKGPYFTPTPLPVSGLTIPNQQGGELRVVGRGVAKLSFDCLNIKPDPRKIGSPVDIVLAARGMRSDGAWEFHVVKAPKRGTWKVKRFKPPTGNKWTTIRIPNIDFRREKLYFVATRTSPSTYDNYRISGMVMTPLVVKSFEVHAIPAPGNAALGRTTPPPGGREVVWAARRTQWRSPNSGTGWRTEISPQTGIAYDPKHKAEIRIILNRPAPAGVTLKLGDVTPTVTAVGSSGRLYRARLELKELEDFLDAGEIPAEIRGKDMFGMGLDGNPLTPPQLEFSGHQTPKLADIKKWEGAEPPFEKPGGVDNLRGEKIPLFNPRKLAAEVALVKLSRSEPAELFYHSEKGAFRPITGGKVDLEIAFDKPMDEESAEILFRGVKVVGKFATPKTWTGVIDVPKDPAGFASARGVHPISIQAKTTYGTAIDTDPDLKDDQPDTTHKVVIDGIPPYIESFEVYGMGQKFHEAAWTGGPDLKRAENLSVSKIGDQRRKLVLRAARDLPAEAKGTLRVEVRSSQPLPGPPAIVLGPVAATNVTGDDTKMFWHGEVSMAALRAKIKPGESVPVSITATDIYGNQLDADPRTVSALSTKNPRWAGYEAKRGGDPVGYGGADTWHEIGAPPRVSFVIVLDASGSMNDGGRMVSAKKGINMLLDNVPAGVELAIIIFQGSSNRAVGFTRDIGKIRAAVDSARANGGTPLAAAIATARKLLESSAHPMSTDWRYRIFSDGQETAGGNVVQETRLLDQAVARRKGKVAKKPKDKVPPPKPTPAEKIQISPRRWTAHIVETESRTGLDWIWLKEVKFTEKELPDGRCSVRLETKSFGVAYGSITDADGSNKKVQWRINSSPSRKRSKIVRATSDDGLAAIQRIRNKASALKAKSSPLAQCRQKIEQEVQREVN
jgi:Mg-chelatase subunit ChlD